MSEILRNYFPSTTRRFVGRGELIKELGDKLAHAGTSSVIVAVTGIMGAGKTRLVAEFAEQHKAQYRVVWRMRAGSATMLAEDYSKLASPPTEKDRSLLDQNAMVRSVRDRLRRLDRWLLVFDDAIDPAMLVDYIPRPCSATGHVVIISRNPIWFEPERTIQVPCLKPDESVELIRQWVGPSPKGKDVLALATELGYLPGALEMAIQHMQATGTTMGDYLRQLRKQPGTILKSGLLYGNKSRLLTDTWNDSVARLQRDTPAAVDLLKLCSFMGPQAIPLRHLREGLKALPPNTLGVSEVSICNDGLAALRREGLVDLSDKDLGLNRIHRTLIRSTVSEEDQKRWISYAAQVLRAAYPEHPSDARKWANYDTLVPHTGPVLSELIRLKLDKDLRGDLYQRLGLYYLGKGCPLRACGRFEKAKDLHCEGHLLPCGDVARDLALLGDASEMLAEWNNADGYYRRARWLYWWRYGNLHSSAVAAIWAKRAVVACARGRFDLGRVWCEKALDLDLRSSRLEPHSKPQPSVAHWIGPFWKFVLKPGWLRTKWKKLHKAQPATGKADRRNPDSSAILRAYGHVLLEFSPPAVKADEAKKQFREAHWIDATKLKDDHPFVARDLVGLGRASEKESSYANPRGQYAEGLGHYREALRIDEAAFGPRHPWVAEDLRCIAQLRLSDLKARTGPKRSGAYYSELASIKQDIDRALDIDKDVFGDEHPSVAWDQVVLGRVFLALGDVRKGESALNNAVAIAKKKYGAKHPWTAEIVGEWSRLVPPA